MHAMRWCGMVLVLAMLGACATDPAGRYAPSAEVPVALWLDPKGRPKWFGDYAKDARAHIQRYHEDTAETRPENWLEQVSPRQWEMAGVGCKPSNTHGVLLVHGLTDSPYLMRDLGNALAPEGPSAVPPLKNGRCLLLRSLLLPGHGTRPGDLLTVRYQDWLAATEWGLRSFAGRAHRVHLVGFSTGGALGLLAAFRQQDKALEPPLASLVLLAPAIQAVDPMSHHPWLLRVAAWSGLRPWVDKDPDRDWAKYESFALNAGAQIALLGRELDKRMDAQPEKKAIPVPVFIAAALNDSTIDTAESIRRFLQHDEARSRLWLAAPDKSPAQRAEVDTKLAERRQKAFAEAMADTRRVKLVDALDTAYPDVRDFAHTALPVDWKNKHYGKGGAYVNCLAYRAKPEVQQACLGDTHSVVYGETPVPADTQVGPLLRRLTFNPKFDVLVQDIRAFLETVTVGEAP